MIHADELPLLTQNKSAADIALMYEELDDKRIIFRESCRQFLSRFLIDNDTQHPYKCDIKLEPNGCYAMSTLETPNLTCMWHDDEGILCFTFNGEYPCEFDGLFDCELSGIIEALS